MGKSPNWAQTGLPSLASQSGSKFTGPWVQGRIAVVRPTGARGQGAEQAEDCCGPPLCCIPEGLLAPPHPISRPVPTERVGGEAGSTRNRRAMQGSLHLPPRQAPTPSVTSHQVQHVLGPSFNQSCMLSTPVWAGTCETACPRLRGQTSNWRSLVVGTQRGTWIGLLKGESFILGIS